MQDTLALNTHFILVRMGGRLWDEAVAADPFLRTASVGLHKQSEINTIINAIK